nr:MAG TPA: hypothetical protein [Caudoviricetes sp.]
MVKSSMCFHLLPNLIGSTFIIRQGMEQYKKVR